MSERTMRSLRYAARSLARTPRFTLVAVFTVALAVGADTAIFSVVNGVLLRPLDYPDPDELVNVWSTAPGLGYDQFPLSPDVYFFYKSESSAFADMGLYSRADVSVTGEGEPERVPALSATASLFSTLGVTPLLGRTYTEEEDLPDAPRVAVLSHELWQRRFGGDPAVLGRTLDVEGEAREIVGVMPPRFDFPGRIQVWLPARLDPAEPLQGSFGFNAVARLAPGVDLRQAEAQLVPLVGRIREQTEGNYTAFLENGRYAPLVHSMKEDEVGSLERPLWILLGTVGIVLLIACANVANLTLIRAEGRRRESAVRTALGATHGTLVRQGAAESLLLAALGGGLGLLAAWLAVPVVLRRAPPQLPRLDEVGMDGRVLLFTIGVTALAALLFGVAPLLHRSQVALLGALKQGDRGGTGARSRARAFLVAAQTALALVLLVGSGLLVRSFREARGTDFGFRYEDLLTFRLSLPAGRYATPTEVTTFHDRLLERLGALPGVESVGLASSLALAQSAPGTAFEIEDRPTAAGQLPPLLRYKFVSPELVETLGVPVVAGRSLQPADLRDGAGHVLVDQAAADRLWPGEEAVGKRLRFAGNSDSTRWYAVEGVVGRVREDGIRRDPEPLLYFPLLGPSGDEGEAVSSATYALRTSTPSALAEAVRAAVWEVDADIPLADVRTGEELVARSLVQMSFTMATLGIAALLALLLGAVGLYGVLAYSVAQRTREIGVRMALGADGANVRGLVLRQVGWMVLIGGVIGIGFALGAGRAARSLLFELQGHDPLSFSIAVVLLAVVALGAGWIPARRAAMTDPMHALRYD